VSRQPAGWLCDRFNAYLIGLGQDRAMKPRTTALRRLLGDRKGATSIEYALIAVLVSIAIILGATGIGTQVNIMLGRASTGLSTNP
jgi:pilus assembly protein Flp/PilA